MDSKTTTRYLSGELGKRLMHLLYWEGGAASVLDKAAAGRISLLWHRDQGNPIAETLDINSWDSSVFGPLSHLSVPVTSVTGG